MATPDRYLRTDVSHALPRDLQRNYDPHRPRRSSRRQCRDPIGFGRAVAVEHAAKHIATLEGERARGNLVPASGEPVLANKWIELELSGLVLAHDTRHGEIPNLVLAVHDTGCSSHRRWFVAHAAAGFRSRRCNRTLAHRSIERKHKPAGEQRCDGSSVALTIRCANVLVNWTLAQQGSGGAQGTARGPTREPPRSEHRGTTGRVRSLAARFAP
jgi:hypothetical protein